MRALMNPCACRGGQRCSSRSRSRSTRRMQPQLIVAVEDLEVLAQAGIAPVRAQQPVRETVKRPYPHAAHRPPEHRFDPVPHLRCGLVGERHRENPERRRLAGREQPCNAMHEHPRLSAAGAGEHEQVSGGSGDRLALRVVQRFEDVGDVHYSVLGQCLAQIPGRLVRAPGPRDRRSRSREHRAGRATEPSTRSCPARR